MRYACEYEGHNKLLTESHVVIVTIANSYYEDRRVSMCAEHAQKAFPWLDFSWAKTTVNEGN
jgi:hypothetical protein